MQENKHEETLGYHIMPCKPNITTDMVNLFLEGHDPMEHIISIEIGYDDAKANIIFVDSDGKKKIRLEDFKPFVWVKNSACLRMFGGKRGTLRKKLNEYNITIKPLYTCTVDNPYPSDRLNNGYKYLFQATKRMSFGKFQSFFQEAGTPIYERKKNNDDNTKNNEIMTVTPVEQFMIATGKRMFKGYEGYDELHRVTFDIETGGLDPRKDCIDQIGIRDNRGYENIITITGSTIEEKNRNEILGIEKFISIIAELKPDTVAGHNTENFDFNFFIVRCEVLGFSFEEISEKYLKYPIYKKKKASILKLGGEVETYFPTVIWGTNVLDSLHATRRAMALDSNFEKANLKYATKYLKLNKKNRVYVPGDIINDTWSIKEKVFAFNDDNGDWYRVSEENPIKDGYELMSGKYIVERYLKDDLYEADKVELKLNESNFLVSKILPTSYTRCATMGTAGIWKLIMLAWCYENQLAVPANDDNARFTGGLSRLLITGYKNKIVKLDFNSLYPSIMLTWWVSTKLDITNIMLHLLNYVLTQREKYKGLKKEAGKKADKLEEQLNLGNLSEEEKNALSSEIQKWKSEKIGNDKKQLPLKILGNSFFGSYGCPMIFNFGDLSCAEKTTCIGRMSLRLMIYHFTKLGYEPIVGDSVTGDTPLVIKYNSNGLIDFKPIEEIYDVNGVGKTDSERKYDLSEKPYKVLCRTGWSDVKYVYCHETDKDIYNVTEGKMSVDCTSDHSLFTEDKKEIKPTDITKETKLEYVSMKKGIVLLSTDLSKARLMGKMISNGVLNRVPTIILNSDEKCMRVFIKNVIVPKNASKTLIAGLNYISKRIEGQLPTS